MSSTFFGLNIAKTGLFSSQRGLNVVSHNISNANTEGYTRQRVDFVAMTPDVFPGGKGTLGTGTDALPVQQIRNEFLDFNFRGENSIYGEYSNKLNDFKTIEAIINEPSESGVTKMMDQFFSSLQELSKSPDNLTIRALVRQREIALIKGVNGMAEGFRKLQGDINFEVKVSVDELNGYANQLTKLNEQIFSSELEGGKANDIRDQRNLILDKMSNIAKISYYEDAQNKFHVAIQGHEIVNHINSYDLKVVERTTKKNEDDLAQLYDIQWADGSTFETLSGKLKGMLDMRDNISGADKGVPYYTARLNEFMDVMATEMNRVSAGGYDLSGKTGNYMFTINGMDTATYKTFLKDKGFNGQSAVDVTETVLSSVTASMTAEEKATAIRGSIKNVLASNPDFSGKKIIELDGKYLVVDKIKATDVTIAKDLDLDLNKFAASDSLTGIPGNGNNMKNLANVRHNTALYDWGSADDYLKTLTSNLGVDGQEAKRVSDNQKVLLDNVTMRKESMSGVSLDEEMSEMVKFQHAYNANARLLTTMDGILDTLVNRVGLAGR